MRHGIQKTVSTEYDGSTLYHFLREGMGLAKKEISRAKFLEDGICVDGERQKVSAQVRKGQQVTVQTEKSDAVSGHLKASNAPLEILYEDMDVVVVNKPSGIPVHPSGRRTFEADTLANRLVHYLREKGEEGVIRIVGRLDKDTSGVVLAAKNRTTAARLEQQRERGRLHKTYLALTDGIPEPEQGTVEKWLAPDPADKTRMQVCPTGDMHGKYAKTCYKTVKKWEVKNTALLELCLKTGRTHQIRVHMQSIGCSLAGDSLYGKVVCSARPESRAKAQEGCGTRMNRTALHAVSLDFCQPFTGEPIHIEAPIPKDIARFMADVLE